MSLKILLVDRDPISSKAYTSILEQKGYSTLFCSSNEEAYLQIRTKKPDLALLEHGVPGMPSEELCRIIKNEPALRDIVVFIISTQNDFETKLEYFAAGADDYLVKPIDPRELAARIVHFLHLVHEWSDRWHKTSPNIGNSSATSSPVSPNVEIVKPIERNPEQYGPYKVESLAGRGGMGRVYRGWDSVLERPVAIKVLTSGLSGSNRDVQRFRREAKLLASISHPGIARIFRFGEQDGEYYFVMEWCPGGSLSELIHSRGKIQPLTAIDLILQCAFGLDAAASKGVVHRDVKPKNIMLGENQQVRIVDFGLAKGSTAKQSVEVTQGGEIFGSPRYMAPEQALSVDVDHRADIYSLGIVFYEMIYGKPPFHSPNAVELVLKHARDPFPSYDSMTGKVPQGLYSVIQKMTQKSPEARYQKYSEVIDALKTMQRELFRGSHLDAPIAVHRNESPLVKGKSLFEVLTAAFKSGVSGVLTISSGTRRKIFFVRKNEIVYLQSGQQKDIWDFLQTKGLIQKQKIPQVSGEVEAVLNACFSEELFTLQEFQEAYREYMKEEIIPLFTLSNQEVIFTEAEIQQDSFGSLTLGDLLLEVTRSRIDVRNFEVNLIQSTIFKPVPDFQKVFYSLTFTPEESFMASRFEGQSLNVDRLCQLTGISDDRVARFVYALHKLGYLES